MLTNLIKLDQTCCRKTWKKHGLKKHGPNKHGLYKNMVLKKYGIGQTWSDLIKLEKHVVEKIEKKHGPNKHGL